MNGYDLFLLLLLLTLGWFAFRSLRRQRTKKSAGCRQANCQDCPYNSDSCSHKPQE